MDNIRLLKNFLLYFPVKLIPAATGFILVTYLYGRLLNGEYVKYSIAVAIALLSMQIGGGWISNAMLYYLSVKPKKASFIINCFLTMLTASFGTSLIAAVASAIFFHDIYVSLIILILCFLQGLFYFCVTVLQAIYNVIGQLCGVIIQAVVQLLLLVFLFKVVGPRFDLAVFTLAMGFLAGMLAMIPFIIAEFHLSIKLVSIKRLKSDFEALAVYGGPMSVWMLATLLMVTVDRFVIGYYAIPYGDSYLSMKDLLLGASGLISMPLLMLLHPLILSIFKNKGFPNLLVSNAISMLVILFSLFWTVWQILGVMLFERVSGRIVETDQITMFSILLTNLLSGIAIYLQKRLEAHKRTLVLAKFACIAASLSVIITFILGARYGLYGVITANIISQLLYGGMIWKSIRKRFGLLKDIMLPFIKGATYWAIGLIGWQLLSEVFSGSSQYFLVTIWFLAYSALALITIRSLIMNLLTESTKEIDPVKTAL